MRQRNQSPSLMWSSPHLPIRPMWAAAMEYSRRNPHDQINEVQARFAEYRALKKLRDLLTLPKPERK